MKRGLLKGLAIVAFVLGVFVCLGARSYAATTVTADAEWPGNATNASGEYVITDAADFLAFANLSKTNDFAGQTIILANDIVFNDDYATAYDGWLTGTAATNVFPMIGQTGYAGADGAGAFLGTFDGKGYSVKGLYMTSTARSAGIFTQVKKTGRVKNVTFDYVYVKMNAAQLGAGVLIGTAYTQSGDAIQDPMVNNVHLMEHTYVEKTGASQGTGGFIGHGWGVGIANSECHATIIAAANGVGGAIGALTAASANRIYNVYVGGTIKSTVNGWNAVGGLVGDVTNGLKAGTLDIKHCLVTANISAARKDGAPGAGGLVGRNGLLLCYLEDSIFAGKITFESTASHQQTGVILAQCNVGADATLTAHHVYGVYGSSLGGSNISCAMGQCVNTSKMKGTPVLLAEKFFEGKNAYTYIVLDENYWQYTDGKPVLKSFASGSEVAYVPEPNQIRADYDYLNVETAASYDISNASQLLALCGAVGFVKSGSTAGWDATNKICKTNYAGVTFNLTADIVLNEGKASDWATTAPAVEFAGIGGANYTANIGFTSIFNGNNHYISGIYQNRGSLGVAGLFAEIEGGLVKDFTIKNSYISTTGTRNGIVAGVIPNSGRVENVSIESDVTIKSTGNWTAGIVGQAWGADIINCNVSATIQGASNVGGIMGSNTTSSPCFISGCKVDGTVVGGANVGGLMACMNGDGSITIEYSVFSGNVTGSGATGGAVGFVNKEGIVIVIGTEIGGTVKSTGQNVGGILGKSDGGKSVMIANCYVHGNIISEKKDAPNYAGGLVGIINAPTGDTNIIDCLVTGSVTGGRTSGANCMGGVIGTLQSSTTAFVANIQNVVVSATISGAASDSVNTTHGIGQIYQSTSGNITVNANGLYIDRSKEQAGKNIKNANNWYAQNVGSAATLRGNLAYAYIFTGANGYAFTNLDFENTWMAVEGQVPCLKDMPTGQEADLTGVIRADFSIWEGYEKENYFSVQTPAELLALAVVSHNYNFDGVEISLDAESAVYDFNEGWTAARGSKPVNEWLPFGNKIFPFQGTIYGNMATIQGLYTNNILVGNDFELFGGLVANAGTNSYIDSLFLKNSYFYSECGAIGSIASRGNGVITNVYSDAIIELKDTSCVGGIVGQIQADGQAPEVTGCQFDGEIYVNKMGSLDAGGIIGHIFYNTAPDINDNYFTGKIYATRDTDATHLAEETNVGGIFGRVSTTGKAGAAVMVQGNLSVGEIILGNHTADHAGAIGGYVENNTTVEGCNNYGRNKMINYLNPVDQPDLYSSNAICYQGEPVEEFATMLEGWQLQSWGPFAFTELDEATWMLVSEDYPVLVMFSTGEEAVPETYEIEVTSRLDNGSQSFATITGQTGEFVSGATFRVIAQEKLGYTFLGWGISVDGGKSYILSDCKTLTFEGDELTVGAEHCTLVALYSYGSIEEIELRIDATDYTIANVNDGGEFIVAKNFSATPGETIIITYTGADDFVAWKNKSGRVLCLNKEYTFTAVSSTDICLEIAPNDQTLVTYMNERGQIIKNTTITEAYEVEMNLPRPATIPGKDFVGYSVNSGEVIDSDNLTDVVAVLIQASAKEIYIVPVYAASANSDVQLTVVQVDSEDQAIADNIVIGGNIGDVVAVVLPTEIDSKPFYMVTDDTGRVVSYKATFYYYLGGACDLYAIYGDFEAPSVPEINITSYEMVAAGAIRADFSVVAQRTLPDDWTVVEQGMLLYLSEEDDFFTAFDEAMAHLYKGDEFAIDVPFAGTNPEGISNLRIKNVPQGEKVFVKAYMICKDAEGNIHIFYSDSIYASN